MKRLICTLLLVGSGSCFAHQPIMDMAPRWEGGYGIQTRVERFNSDTVTWVEGVYTFKPSVRTTFKIPYQDGDAGNLILGMPLKHYVNDGARTANWGVTPSVQLPTGKHSKSDVGLSLSYSSETPSFYQLYDLYTWQHRVGLDINAGFSFPRPGGGALALLDITSVASDDGDLVLSGPVFVYFWSNVMIRAEYKTQIYEKNSDLDGDFFSIGIGLVF